MIILIKMINPWQSDKSA